MIPSFLWLALLSFACSWGSAPIEGRTAISSLADDRLVFDRYHSVGEVETYLHELAQAYPRWFRTEVIGHSIEGRALTVLTASDFEAPTPLEQRPGFWIDASIHGGELETTEVVLRLIEALRIEIERGFPAPDYLAERCLHLVPVLNPDGRSRALADPPQRGRHNAAPDGGVDLNRDFPARWSSERARAAGDPQPETVAVMSFWRRHPQIVLAASYHSSVRGFLVPPLPRTRAEEQRYAALAEPFERQLDTPRLAVPSHARGTTMDWFFAARGCIAFTVEIEGAFRPDVPEGERDQRILRRYLRTQLEQLTAGHAEVLLDLARTLPRSAPRQTR